MSRGGLSGAIARCELPPAPDGKPRRPTAWSSDLLPRGGGDPPGIRARVAAPKALWIARPSLDPGEPGPPTRSLPLYEPAPNRARSPPGTHRSARPDYAASRLRPAV